MIRIFIDEQRTRKQYRVRVRDGTFLLATYYANDKKDAKSLKYFAHKLINETRD